MSKKAMSRELCSKLITYSSQLLLYRLEYVFFVLININVLLSPDLRPQTPDSSYNPLPPVSIE